MRYLYLHCLDLSSIAAVLLNTLRFEQGPTGGCRVADNEVLSVLRVSIERQYIDMNDMQVTSSSKN